MSEQQERPSRKAIRDRLLGQKHAPRTKSIILFGEELELRQPSLGEILEVQSIQDDKHRGVRLMVQYTFVPGTDERVFEEGDIPDILQWPMGQDLVELQMAIAELTGVDIASAMEELKANPLEGASSN